MIVLASVPGVPNRFGPVVIPVLNAISESACTGCPFGSTLTRALSLWRRVVNVTGIDPGWSYWRLTVLVAWSTTLTVCAVGALPSGSTMPVAAPPAVIGKSPAGRLRHRTQPVAPVVPLNEPAPLPVRVIPVMPLLLASSTWTSSEPLFGTSEPFGGEITVPAVTGLAVALIPVHDTETWS